MQPLLQTRNPLRLILRRRRRRQRRDDLTRIRVFDRNIIGMAILISYLRFIRLLADAERAHIVSDWVGFWGEVARGRVDAYREALVER